MIICYISAFNSIKFSECRNIMFRYTSVFNSIEFSECINPENRQRSVRNIVLWLCHKTCFVTLLHSV